MSYCNVYFLDDDKKTVLATIKVEYGKKAVYPYGTPVKEEIQGVKFEFIGWEGEEKLNSVTEDTIVFAKYSAETDIKSNESSLFNASLQNAESMNYNAVAEAGQKVISQEKAIAKDPRTAEKIVKDIIENGKTEVGQEMNKDMEK